MRGWLRDHGLLIANLLLFVIFFIGMVLSGVRVYNSEQLEHGEQAVSLGRYLLSGDFYEATFENWESEFLQMAMYVVLTAFLFQRGSSESKPIDEPAPQDEDPREAADRPGCAVAGTPRRLGLDGVRALALGPVLHLVLRIDRRACHRRRQAYSEEELAHGGEPREHPAVPRHLAVLVRVVPELAERIPCGGCDRLCLGLPAATWLAGV